MRRRPAFEPCQRLPQRHFAKPLVAQRGPEGGLRRRLQLRLFCGERDRVPQQHLQGRTPLAARRPQLGQPLAPGEFVPPATPRGRPPLDRIGYVAGVELAAGRGKTGPPKPALLSRPGLAPRACLPPRSFRGGVEPDGGDQPAAIEQATPPPAASTERAGRPQSAATFRKLCVGRPLPRVPQSSRWTRSIRSWRSCASIDSVAIGRASSRLMPIGSPVSSQKP
jgi:hypothetical protein